MAKELRAPKGWKYLAGEKNLFDYEPTAGATVDYAGHLRLVEDEGISMFDLVTYDVTKLLRAVWTKHELRPGRDPVLTSHELVKSVQTFFQLENWRAYIFGDDAEHPREVTDQDVADFAYHLSAAWVVAFRPLRERTQRVRGGYFRPTGGDPAEPPMFGPGWLEHAMLKVSQVLGAGAEASRWTAMPTRKVLALSRSDETGWRADLPAPPVVQGSTEGVDPGIARPPKPK